MQMPLQVDFNSLATLGVASLIGMTYHGITKRLSKIEKKQNRFTRVVIMLLSSCSQCTVEDKEGLLKELTATNGD